MNKSFTLIGTALFAGFGLVASNALGTTYEWTGDGDGFTWTSAANWDVGGSYPDDDSDVAIIGTSADQGVSVTLNADLTVGAMFIAYDSTVLINNSPAPTLTIDQGSGTSGLLSIEAGSVLDIQRGALALVDNNGNPHPIGGELNLLLAASAIYIQGEDAEFGPHSGTDYGEVVGANSASTFAIDKGLQFENFITMSGLMTVTVGGSSGSAPLFVNKGVVRANGSGVFSFQSSVALSDISGADWQALTSSSAVMAFYASATLVGDFLLDDDATIQLATASIVVDVSSGSFPSPDGFVDADTGSTRDDTQFIYPSGTVEDEVEEFPL